MPGCYRLWPGIASDTDTGAHPGAATSQIGGKIARNRDAHALPPPNLHPRPPLYPRPRKAAHLAPRSVLKRATAHPSTKSHPGPTLHVKSIQNGPNRILVTAPHPRTAPPSRRTPLIGSA